MKFRLFFNVVTVCALVMLVSTNARARLCDTMVSPPDSGTIDEIVDHDNCSNIDLTPRYYALYGGGYVKATNCTSCYTGDTVEETVQIRPPSGGVCDINYVRCECGECPNCTSSDWVSYNTTHESRTLRTCNCGICSATTEYRCKDGYYGSPVMGSKGCSSCESVCGNIATTSTAGSNESRFSCCAAAGSTGSNSNGSFTITSQVCVGDPLVLD